MEDQGQAKQLDFKGRVKEEKRELDDKIRKLQQFIETNGAHEDLSYYEQGDLIKQTVLMQKYSSVLGRRIRRFDY